MKVSVSIYITSLLKGKRTVADRIVKRENILRKSPDLKKTLQHFKSAGLHGIELIVRSHTTDTQITKVKAILQEFDIEVLSIHQPLSKIFKINLKQIERLFIIAHNLGAKIIVIHVLALRKEVYNTAFITQLKTLEQKYDIHIALENTTKNIYSNRKTHVWREEEFTRLINSIDFRVTMDTAHLGQSKGDIISFFLQNKDKIVNIHLSDYKKQFYQSEHLPLGYGILPIAGFVKLLKKEGYDNLVTFEIDSSFDKIFASAQELEMLLLE